MTDTIFALASARGKAGLSVIRISGPKSHEAARMFSSIPVARQVGLRKLVWNNVLLDEALVLVFDKGASFTGEDVIEFHLHGSRAVVAAVIAALSEIHDLRPAEPGEFTRRALENGCLDLTQVEGLADLIDAETDAQRIQSLRVFSGAIGKKIELWRKDIIRAASLLEATIDFADEDVPIDVRPEVRGLLGKLITAFQSEIEGSLVSERVREGFEVAIVGRPNAGKSTLLNALAGRQAAITSEVAGTTRDVIEVRMDIAGLPVTFLDTAGLRDTDDMVELLGVGLAQKRATAADMRIFLLDGSGGVDGVKHIEGDLVVTGKADLLSTRQIDADFSVSGLTGAGVTQLVEKIGSELSKRSSGSGIFVRERHRAALKIGVKALETTLFELDKQVPILEIAAEELRGASRALEVLIGRVDVEQLLGEIFSSFCIGK